MRDAFLHEQVPGGHSHRIPLGNTAFRRSARNRALRYEIGSRIYTGIALTCEHGYPYARGSWENGPAWQRRSLAQDTENGRRIALYSRKITYVAAATKKFAVVTVR